MHTEFAVIVIGGGHAGVEAAWAAANVLASKGDPAPVALVTLDPSKIGVMSCNPAIGGLAKGQLVREVDALNGIMGLATDATGIQFRMLNTSKGAAVHGPRAQCDKHAYARAVQVLINSRTQIHVIAGSVETLHVENRLIRGVAILTSAGPRTLHTASVVLTTGTFMRGLMHTGENKTSGGRHGEAAAHSISASLAQLGFELGRLKTGTPPRLKRSSLDLSALRAQHGDSDPVPFSDLTLHGLSAPTNPAAPSLQSFPVLPQISCFETSTNASCHTLIRANLHRAPMYSGQIESAGPRYCPSIEDKVVRFQDRDVHHVFLEPESLEDDWIYCNGISTSLPADVQDALVRALPGCENAVIYRHGYAVEYDMVRPHQIHATGMTKLIDGLFLAGQINGTSGYEEAAAQGLIAGVNAANRAIGAGEFALARHEAYIGVLMDDLVTKTPVEPYRMFTSRAEHRLILRADNAPERLSARAQSASLYSGDLGTLRQRVMAHRAESRAVADIALSAATLGGRPLIEAMRGSDISRSAMLDVLPQAVVAAIPRAVWTTAHADYRYAAYMNRQRAEIKRLHESEQRHLPATLDYHVIHGLRNEAKSALSRFRPSTFGQAGRLEGVTPSDLSIVAVHMRRYGEKSPRCLHACAMTTLVPMLAVSEASELAISLLALLATAAIVATIFRKLRLEAIPGFLVAGFLVGPVIGFVRETEIIDQISGLATVLLMFIIGLSLEIDTVRRGLVPMLIVGAVSTLAFVLASTPVALAFDRSLPESLAIGMALSMSSTALLLKILQQRREVKAMIGRLCIGISISQDILSVVFLGLMPPLAAWAASSVAAANPVAETVSSRADIAHIVFSGLRTVVAIAALLLFGRYVLPRALGLVAKAASGELVLIFSAATALGAAIAASLLNFSPELGAFLAGLLLASTPYKQQLVSQLSPLKDLLLPIFFMTVGLQVDPAVIASGWGRILLGVAALFVVKTLLLSVSAWALGASTSLATLAGFYLWQGGEFSLIILDQARRSGLLPEDAQGRVIVIVAVSLVISPLLVKPAHHLARRLAFIRPARWIRSSAMRERPVNETQATPENPDSRGTVVVAGYGPVGRDVAESSARANWSVSIIELNPKTVLKQTELGRTIVYGDVRSPEVLEAAGVPHADAVVITIPDDATAIAACRVIREMNPGVLLAVRTSFLSQAIQAKENGADLITIEEVVTADSLSRGVLSALQNRITRRAATS